MQSTMEIAKIDNIVGIDYNFMLISFVIKIILKKILLANVKSIFNYAVIRKGKEGEGK